MCYCFSFGYYYIADLAFFLELSRFSIQISFTLRCPYLYDFKESRDCFENGTIETCTTVKMSFSTGSDTLLVQDCNRYTQTEAKRVVYPKNYLKKFRFAGPETSGVKYARVLCVGFKSRTSHLACNLLSHLHIQSRFNLGKRFFPFDLSKFFGTRWCFVTVGNANSC